MAKLVTHKFVSSIPDGDDTGLVRPSNWNDTHDVSGVAESGTNTDITSMTGITGGISSPDYIQFDTTYATLLTAGQLGWDGNDTLAVGMAGGNVIQHIGEDQFIYIKADATITKGQVIMFTGAVGASGVLTGAPATGVTNPQYIMGVAAEDLAHNAFGLIQTFGELTGLNTNAFNEGDVLYYDSAVTGGLTSTFPATGPIVTVASVAKKSGGNGVLVIRVTVTQRITAGTGATITQALTGTTVAVTNPYNPASVAITGGTINGTTIGATTPSSIVGTTITGQTGVLKGTGTNLVVRSQEFDNASWTKSNTTVTANATTAPDGTATADKIIASATTATHFLFQGVTSGTGISFQVSVYAKKGEYNFFRIENGNTGVGAYFNLNTGVVVSGTGATIVDAGSGWYRCSLSTTTTTTSFNCVFAPSVDGTTSNFTGDGTSGIFLWGCQVEIGSTANTYIPTTTTAVYGTPTLSFSGVSTLGLESNGALFLQPAGTGAIQAQATTSTTAGGNARGANAVDFQMVRDTAARVASGSQAFIGAGRRNTASGEDSFVGGGFQNTASSSQASVVSGARNNASGGTSFIGSGNDNTANLTYGTVVGGQSNTASGYFGFVGNGSTNSTTSSSSVTTQSATMNGTTAVTLSGSNANIKVGQLITGTYITFPTTYVAAISGTSLTLSTVASGSGTATLSFFTPHGVVVGGGNNQATGSYSFIGGGGDAGTATNRNVASGDWSFVGGGQQNTASGIGSVVAGGGTFGSGGSGNTASGVGSAILGGWGNTASGTGASVISGNNNTSNASRTTVLGSLATARAINGIFAMQPCNSPISASGGINQTSILVLARQTTDATATALASDSSAAGTTNQVILPNNSAYFFRGEVISGVTGGGNTKGWTIEGVIKRGANAASTALVGTPTVTSSFADAGASTWTIAVTADTTNGGLRVTFTGQASTTIRTVCQIRTTEMTY
jgi:hypothetical protein